MFEALLNSAYETSMYLGGKLDENMRRSERTKLDNNRWALVNRFKDIFPGDIMRD